MNMKSFKNTIIRSIKAKRFTREYFEETVASWLLHGWLTEEEAAEVFVVLDEVFPLEETEDETEETEAEETEE